MRLALALALALAPVASRPQSPEGASPGQPEGAVPGEPAAAVPGQAERSPAGIAFAARLGAALPSGQAFAGRDLSDVVGGGVPVWFDIGYRFGPPFSLGLYFSWTFVSGHSGSCGAADCAGGDLRAGIEGFWHFTPGSRVDLWAGLGLGLEVLAVVSRGSAPRTSAGYGAGEVNLQLGVDIPVGQVAVGPFLAAGFSRYSTESVSDGAVTVSTTIPSDQRRGHSWLFLGFRFAYRL